MQGPHATEHLANERTYLAYLRTSVSLITFGLTINKISLAIIQNNKTQRHSGLLDIERLGVDMFVFGGLLLVFALIRYLRVRKEIDQGTFTPASVDFIVITGLVVTFCVIAFFWVF